MLYVFMSRVDSDWSTISIEKSVKESLKGVGFKGETYNTVIKRLLDNVIPAPQLDPVEPVISEVVLSETLEE